MLKITAICDDDCSTNGLMQLFAIQALNLSDQFEGITVFEISQQNTVIIEAIGKCQKNLLDFIRKGWGDWISFKKDTIIERNDHNYFSTYQVPMDASCL